MHTLRNLTLAGVMAASAVSASALDPYKVTAPMTADDEGAMAFIINYDNGQTVDSVLVDQGIAAFRGMMDEPVAVKLTVDGRPRAQFILEPGSIALDPKTGVAFGSPLNDKYKAFNDSVKSIAAEFRNAPDDASREEIYGRYTKFALNTLDENLDNPIGYLILVQTASDLTPEELDAYLAKEPSLKETQYISRMLEMNRRKAATDVGAKYADFDINGQKLSDYVGKDGKYLLVDFWASWCGPCKRQIPVIKELLAEHSDKLNVLGVAVWDEPDDTRRAIKEHGITWPGIIGADRIPTDIYGIAGIPCIMLIGPDGTILSRDKQGDELKADVARLLK